MKLTHRLALLPLLLLMCAFGLSVAGCGDDDDEPTPTATATPSPPENVRTQTAGTQPPPAGKWAYKAPGADTANASCCWDEVEIKNRIASGLIRRTTEAWKGGAASGGWARVETFPEFEHLAYVD